MALILDTGPLLAALDAADPDHVSCARLISQADETLVVPTLVLAELDYWCHRRLNAEVWLGFLEDVIAGAYIVEAPTHGDLERCRTVQRDYRDLGIGVVDASVFALAERFGEKAIATLDQRHFRTLRPSHVESLRLLPGDA